MRAAPDGKRAGQKPREVKNARLRRMFARAFGKTLHALSRPHAIKPRLAAAPESRAKALRPRTRKHGKPRPAKTSRVAAARGKKRMKRAQSAAFADKETSMSTEHDNAANAAKDIDIKTYIETRDTFGRHLGVTVIEAREGYARASMPLDERHKNGVGLAHGGAVFGLADIAFAAAANASLENAVLNVSTAASYIKAGKVGPLEAEAKVVSNGRRMVVYEVRVTDAQGTLLSRFQITGYRTDAPALGK